MKKTNKPKLDVTKAEKIFAYGLLKLRRDENGNAQIVQGLDDATTIYRDEDGCYWWRYDKEGGNGLFLTTEQLMEQIVWFYCAYIKDGDLRSSNDRVAWLSEERDINAVIREACDPENCKRYTEIRNTYFW